MSRVRTSSGHVLAVQSRLLGSGLDGAHTAGATTLTVQDCSDFDDDLGGSLTLNGTTYAYSDVDDDAGTLTISPALVADADDGDEATILDPILGSPQSTVTASVTEDGEDPGDPIEADVASGIAEQLPEGVRGVAGEAVTITWDEDDDPTVTGLVGLNVARPGLVRGYQEFATATGPGDVTVPLTFFPLSDTTVHVYWGPLAVQDDAWSFSADGWSVIIADPDGVVQSGDRFMVKYLYTSASTKPATVNSSASAAATSSVTSLSVPISSPSVGDKILLATGRATAPVGWTLIGDAVTGTTHLRVYSKVSDGTETSVTISGSDVLGGITVVCTASSLITATGVDDPKSATSFQAPAIAGTPLVSFAIFDGPGFPPDEHITGADQTMLENLKVQSGGLYGLAAATERATFTSTTGGGSSFWLGVSVAAA